MVSRPAGAAFITPAIYSSYGFLLRWRAALVVLHFATAVALAGSPSARHSPTWHQHEGKVRTCSQQVLQERLAIGTVTRGERRLSAKSQHLRGRILLRAGVPFHLQARTQEGLRFQGLISNRFLGEWTYILGLAFGWCRGVGCPPSR